jgi:hypothetical protein
VSVVESSNSTDLLGHIIRECLRKGFPVEIDGLGTFRFDPSGRLNFGCSGPRVFIAYVVEDLARVERLCSTLAMSGLDPWLDRRKLTPGQDWPRAIERAISVSDFIVPCLSTNSVRKRGQFQRELRLALDYAAQMPLDDILVMPVRLDDCKVPPRIAANFQYVDAFPDWNLGVGRLLQAIWKEANARAARR